MPVGDAVVPASASVVITVVVVLPCVPATPTIRMPATAAPSASARRMIGIPSAVAAAISTCVAGIADDATTARAPKTNAAS